MSEQRPIIIKKVKKGHGGHHGGAWKLAYADFVTAMMAFFLLMWLLGSTTKGSLQGIAEYFQNPFKVAMSGGEGSGDANSVIRGGGEDLSRSVGQVKRTNEGTRQILTKASEDQAGKLRLLKDKLERMIAASATLKQFRDQLKLDLTREGLRIQIIDAANRPMFELGSAVMQPYARDILREIAPVIGELPNVLTITGHTDARPLGNPAKGYSNWELSADRANAARRELVGAGLTEQKILRVIGLAESVPFVPQDPLDPTNRRIAIVVMNKDAEDSVRANIGESVEVREGAGVRPETIDPDRAPPVPARPQGRPALIPPPAVAPAPATNGSAPPASPAPAAPATPPATTPPPPAPAAPPAAAPAPRPVAPPAGQPSIVPPLPPGLVPARPATP